jgi:hypothetical protein
LTPICGQKNSFEKITTTLWSKNFFLKKDHKKNEHLFGYQNGFCLSEGHAAQKRREAYSQTKE